MFLRRPQTDWRDTCPMPQTPRRFLSPLVSGLTLLLGAGAAADHEDAVPDDSRMLRPYVAEYETRSRGLTSTTTRTLRRSDTGTAVHTYHLGQEISVRLLGANLISVDESSHFARVDGSLVPGAYRYEQTGIKRRDEHIRFDWEKRSAQVSTRDGEQTFRLESGTLDRLSLIAQIRLDVQAAIQADSGQTDFHYPIMEDDGMAMHLYRLDGRETLETPIGRLETVRLERIREPDSSRTTTVWLAPEAGYVMARLLHTEEDDPDTELVLSSLEWTDTARSGER